MGNALGIKQHMVTLCESDSLSIIRADNLIKLFDQGSINTNQD